MTPPFGLWRILLVAACSLTVAGSARAAERVDVQLVLAVDVSLSMSPEELEIQRRGYATAMADRQVISAITDGAYGRIAVTYVEWAGKDTQRVIVPWTVIASRADAEAFAGKLTEEIPRSARRTSISGGLAFSADLIAESGIEATKRVIDVSGDGPNNDGVPVVGARDRVVAQGIVINGLPLMTNGGFTSAFDVPDLDVYYKNCVIGGPGAFMFPVKGWEQFPEAVRRKLVMELAARPANPPVVKAAAEPAYDCMVGEKIWSNRPWNRNPP
ncbi:MAG: DUF1194 domain-containing protein [Rhizobiaceae bacterium]